MEIKRYKSRIGIGILFQFNLAEFLASVFKESVPAREQVIVRAPNYFSKLGTLIRDTDKRWVSRSKDSSIILASWNHNILRRNKHLKGLIGDWLIDGLIDWLIDSFVRSLAGWLAGWLADWLTDWLTD